MNIRHTFFCWGPTSLAVLFAASLSAPVLAQSDDEQAKSDTPKISDTAISSAEQVTLNSPSDLPRGQYRIPDEGDIVGERYTITIENHEDTLVDVARRHNIGFEEIRMANPDVSLWVPGKGTEVVIPAQYILPPGEREGIVVNLSELRLYYYPADKPGIVETYPVSVGREEFATPVGKTKTTVKVKDPAWSPPESMRREAKERGEPAPSVVPPGPDNPLGRHAILLGLPSYLIHGTNRPDGVGMRVSRGCIRMYPEDIESLYDRVPSGTQVNLIDAPFKAGMASDGTLFMQSYPQLEENLDSFEPLLKAMERVSELTEEKNIEVDYARIRSAVESPDGRFIALFGPQAPLPEPEEPAAEEESDPLEQGIFEQIELSDKRRGDDEA
ncbi:MAG: L,D-transpeptidase [Halomonas sp. HL-48]|nr:L,D-transpeptidase family protein [Halomonas sp. HL-48]KPQ23826.1 MAG: L,D-transpeptidase [Halomonas sp. HL-48]